MRKRGGMAMGNKCFNMTIVYGIIAMLSVLLLLGYLLWEKKRERRFVELFSCVAIVRLFPAGND